MFFGTQCRFTLNFFHGNSMKLTEEIVSGLWIVQIYRFCIMHMAIAYSLASGYASQRILSRRPSPEIGRVAGRTKGIRA